MHTQPYNACGLCALASFEELVAFVPLLSSLMNLRDPKGSKLDEPETPTQKKTYERKTPKKYKPTVRPPRIYEPKTPTNLMNTRHQKFYEPTAVKFMSLRPRRAK